MDLKESLKFIRDTVYKYLSEEEYEAFVYGSRADGTAQKWSDIDVGIRGTKKVPFDVLATIRGEIEDSDIPYLVDVVDFNRASEKFARIATKGVLRL